MKQQDVLNCSFSSWYQTFRNVTIKSRILPLPQEVLEYLQSDESLVLPEESMSEIEHFVDNSDNDSDSEKKNWNSNINTAQAPSLKEFDGEIRRAISSLGGKVFPKLNWSSPKDATWITTTSTLACTNPAEIYLLLKSSNFVTHDLTRPFARCTDWNEDNRPTVKYELILRRWHDMNPGGEFRCFVRNKVLQAISQRHCTDYFSFIHDDRQDIVKDIEHFYNSVIRDKFPDKNYVFDIYRKEEGKVYVLDFNPYGTVTDGLMFEWGELDKDDITKDGTSECRHVDTPSPVFRYVKSSHGVMPNPYGSSGIPTDFVDLASGEDPYKLIDLLRLKQRSDDSSSDSEESSQSPHKS